MAVAIPLIAGGVGAWAGTAIGIGAAAGWAIGAAAGQIIEQQVFGPQIPPNALTDLSVQTSAWGTGIPEIFGVQRVSGNIIWSTDKRLVGGSQGKFGGKGGGGGGKGKNGKKGTGQQGYYEVSIAFALCEGTIAGIKRIWAGGDLIYDDSAPVYVPSMDPNNPQGSYQQFDASNNPVVSSGGSSLGSWTLYHGTTDQPVDGTIAANGSGNGDGGIPYQQVTLANGFEYTYGAPAFGKLGSQTAYRGVAYIVFPNLNIGYGGSIPPLSFEVVGKQVNGIQYEPMQVLKSGYAAKNWVTPGYIGNMSDGESIVLTTNAVYNASGNLYGTSYPWFDIAGIFNTTSETFTPLACDFVGGSGGSANYAIGFQVGSEINFCGGSLIGRCEAPNGAIQNLGHTAGGSHFWGDLNGVAWFSSDAPGNPYFTSPSKVAAGNAVVYDYGNAYYHLSRCPSLRMPSLNGNLWILGDGPTLIGFNGASFTYLPVTGTGGVKPFYIFTDGSRLFGVIIASDPSNPNGSLADVYVLDTSTGNASLYMQLKLAYTSSVGDYEFFVANGSFYSFVSGSGYNALTIHNADGTAKSALLNSPIVPGSIFLMNRGIFFGGNPDYGSSGYWWLVSYGDVVAPNPFSLPGAIESVCQRAGFTSYDVSLVPNVDVNFTRHAGTAARDILKVLCQIYALDMVDSAGILRFVPRGQPISAQLQISDIGFAADKGTPPAPYILTRAAEVDLPRSVTLKYTSALANYNSYAQQFQISAAASYGKDVTVSVPLTLDDSTALNAAMLLCVAPHVEKNAYAWTTSLEWLNLEPGDVVQMPWGVTRITQVALRDLQKQPLLEFHGVIDATYVLNSGYGQAQAVLPPVLAASASAQAALGAASGGSFVTNNKGPSSNSSAVSTRAAPYVGVAYAQFLETPPMRSTDTSPYYMIASYSTGNVFIGTALYESTDGGTTFNQIAQQSNSAVVGSCNTVLPGTQPWTWDTTSTLDVYLAAPYMQLSGATDTQVIQGANVALVGSELIQFANATLMTDSQGTAFYRLSRLLRGRRGTEWAISGHGIGETFTLIQSDEEAPVNYALSDLNNPYEFKTATVGQDISLVGATSFAPTGIWYKPWAVAQLKATKDVSNDWTVTFEPRARLNGVWGSGLAPALDPDTTTYSMDIYYGGSIRRTATGSLAAPTTFTYTAAMQAADGIPAGASGITFNVYQVGTLGRGYESSITT